MSSRDIDDRGRMPLDTDNYNNSNDNNPPPPTGTTIENMNHSSRHTYLPQQSTQLSDRGLPSDAGPATIHRDAIRGRLVRQPDSIGSIEEQQEEQSGREDHDNDDDESPNNNISAVAAVINSLSSVRVGFGSAARSTDKTSPDDDDDDDGYEDGGGGASARDTLVSPIIGDSFLSPNRNHADDGPSAPNTRTNRYSALTQSTNNNKKRKASDTSLAGSEDRRGWVLESLQVNPGWTPEILGWRNDHSSMQTVNNVGLKVSCSATSAPAGMISGGATTTVDPGLQGSPAVWSTPEGPTSAEAAGARGDGSRCFPDAAEVSSSEGDTAGEASSDGDTEMGGA
ncbi:hypothetical protein NKR23_g1918 [Pleurostoma richardsiae]|uniref:Uncharacterized protein n=1 Tax=Pleurostoma richardsiae TaxID=41990 RepID=A0AA38VIW5_9PEZI|nr:hypothetical protein NKR23_g1918 [Pleurostoma richardsiae]